MSVSSPSGESTDGRVELTARASNSPYRRGERAGGAAAAGRVRGAAGSVGRLRGNAAQHTHRRRRSLPGPPGTAMALNQTM
eukprot:8277513-Pyramimonas_sp.AAC.1